MPRKEYRLLARDVRFFLVGGSDAVPSVAGSVGLAYPLDWSFQLDRPQDYFEPFDDFGVPLRNLPGAIDCQYLPSRVAAYALANWNRWISTKSNCERERFESCCKWFLDQPGGAFRHNFALVGMPKGWLSCIAQGEGLSVLVRGYTYAPTERIADAASEAVAWLHKPVAAGGLLDRLPDGKAFLEEYPSTRYRHVLNGCLYALVGLDDYVAAGLDASGASAQLRDDVLGAIETNLSSWEIGDWTTYDFHVPSEGARVKNPNTLTYQSVHWILLDYLGKRLHRPALVAASNRWRAASESFVMRAKALGGKLLFRLSHGYKV